METKLIKKTKIVLKFKKSIFSAFLVEARGPFNFSVISQHHIVAYHELSLLRNATVRPFMYFRTNALPFCVKTAISVKIKDFKKRLSIWRMGAEHAFHPLSFNFTANVHYDRV
jgi:hypothetical protein